MLLITGLQILKCPLSYKTRKMILSMSSCRRYDPPFSPPWYAIHRDHEYQREKERKRRESTKRKRDDRWIDGFESIWKLMDISKDWKKYDTTKIPVNFNFEKVKMRSSILFESTIVHLYFFIISHSSRHPLSVFGTPVIE